MFIFVFQILGPIVAILLPQLTPTPSPLQPPSHLPLPFNDIFLSLHSHPSMIRFKIFNFFPIFFPTVWQPGYNSFLHANVCN